MLLLPRIHHFLYKEGREVFEIGSIYVPESVDEKTHIWLPDNQYDLEILCMQKLHQKAALACRKIYCRTLLAGAPNVQARA